MHLRTSDTPLLTSRDIPPISKALTDVSSVFNPGACIWNDTLWLMLRVQDRGRRTWLVPAKAPVGKIHEIEVLPHAAIINGIEQVEETIYHCYDPRLTVLDGQLYMVFAADCEGCCRLGVARCLNDDLSRFELLSFDPSGDSRNGVLFPEKINGRYARLERPNEVELGDGPTSGDAIYYATSEDLRTWTLGEKVMSGRWHFWDERIGSGPPPLLIPEDIDSPFAGHWLHLYHGIATHFSSANIYQGGAVLLDRHEPHKVLARTAMNLLEPRQPWELIGQVPNVVFPSGMVLLPDESGKMSTAATLQVFYGAADTVVGLATATLGELLAAIDRHASR